MAARNNAFATVARVPTTVLLMYHRWTGRAAVIHSTVHFAMVTRPWLTTNDAVEHFHHRFIQVGMVGWCSLCIIAITSVSLIRRRCFEAFYYTHFVFLAFVIGAMIHVRHGGPEFLLPGLILWGIDRLIRFRYNFRSTHIVETAQYEGGVTKLKVRGIPSLHPCKIVWIQIPSVCFWDWHPFTVASVGTDNEITVAIRGLGGYTRAVQTAVDVAQQFSVNSEESTSLRVRVDGPYGVGRLQWGLYPLTVLIAGGIGITPGISIAAYIMQRASRPAGEPTACPPWHIHLVWIVKHREHIKWFAEELKALADLASVPTVRATFDLTIHITQESTPDSDGTSVKDEKGLHIAETYGYDGPGRLVLGRPDILQLFNNLRQRYMNLDAAVNVCGPGELVSAVRTAAAKWSRPSGVFYVEDEAFEL
jgi:predicted ferric reductase